MAKKKFEDNQPVLSSLPLPKSDSPLVIDLPDGQKLVVGKMETGTVIEVATWRGTGRPDSRTNRLMLGMSSTEAIEQKDKSPTASKTIDNSKFAKFKRLLELGNKVIKNVSTKLNERVQILIEKRKSKVKSENSPIRIEKVSLDNTSHSSRDLDPDVEAFLARIKSKHLLDQPIGRTPSSSSTSGPKSPINDRTSKKKTPKLSKKTVRKR